MPLTKMPLLDEFVKPGTSIISSPHGFIQQWHFLGLIDSKENRPAPSLPVETLSPAPPAASSGVADPFASAAAAAMPLPRLVSSCTSLLEASSAPRSPLNTPPCSASAAPSVLARLLTSAQFSDAVSNHDLGLPPNTTAIYLASLRLNVDALGQRPCSK